jgi:S-formylglutathione hydrolase FrmB
MLNTRTDPDRPRSSVRESADATGRRMMKIAGGATIAAVAGRRVRIVLTTAGARPSWPSVLSQTIACPSPSLDERLPVQVYLPPGYTASGRRYPVIYFLHGLPGTPASYTQNAFIADAILIADRRAIVVAPQGARDDNSDREYLDWSATEDWPRAISHDLTSCIDRRFATIASRFGRALIGVSAGGYGAMNIGLRNLQTFAVTESWSGYFVATDPSGRDVLQLGSPAAQQAALVPRAAGLARELARWPSLIGFYIGRADGRFLGMNEAFDAALDHSAIAHVFRTYAGGHALSLWSSQAPGWLRMALTYLSTGRTVPPGASN